MLNEFLSDLVLDNEAGELKNKINSRYNIYTDGCTEIIECLDKEKTLTLCMKSEWYFDKDYCSLAAKSLARQIKKLMPSDATSALTVGIGNRYSCADRLGCEVAQLINLSGICTQGRLFVLSNGTYEQSGIDITDASIYMARLAKADLIIAVDALRTSSFERLCSVIQLSRAGIAPGSGVGSERRKLTSCEAGIPVISIGFPTVIGVKREGEKYSILTPMEINHIVDEAAKLIFNGITDVFCE